MSSWDIPELLRNFWKSASFGNDCFLVCWNCLLTSASVTLTPWSLASRWIHWAEIRNWSTWSRRPAYSCWHWALNWAVVGEGWPLAGLGAVFCFCAMHLVKLGGSGTCASDVCRPGIAPWDEIAATCIQWFNWALVIGLPL